MGRDLFEEMLAHAREDAPNECCGMIAAQDGRAVRLYRGVNARSSPVAYEFDSRSQLEIELAIDDAGFELGAIYHSHTRSEPYPSQTDINLAFHPHALYVIVGLAGEEADVRSFRILDRARVEEAELVVED